MILLPWLNYRTNKAQKDNKGLRESVAYKAANNIGILFCNDEQRKIEDADKLISLLKKDDKKVKVIAQEHKSAIKHLPYDTFSHENFSFWGNCASCDMPLKWSHCHLRSMIFSKLS